MTMRELKKYVLEHRNDQAAFQVLMDRVDAQPQDQIYGEVDAEEFARLAGISNLGILLRMSRRFVLS